MAASCNAVSTHLFSSKNLCSQHVSSSIWTIAHCSGPGVLRREPNKEMMVRGHVSCLDNFQEVV